MKNSTQKISRGPKILVKKICGSKIWVKKISELKIQVKINIYGKSWSNQVF